MRENPIYRVEEVAWIFGVRKETIYRQIKRGTIPFEAYSGKNDSWWKVIGEEELLQYIEKETDINRKQEIMARLNRISSIKSWERKKVKAIIAQKK